MWTATKRGPGKVDVSGPVGDALNINIESSSSAFTWNSGWTWLGQVRQTAAGSVVSTFSVADSSTSSQLSLVASIANTSGWTSGDAMVYAIQGTKSGATVTLVEGKVVPTDDVAHT